MIGIAIIFKQGVPQFWSRCRAEARPRSSVRSAFGIGHPGHRLSREG